MQKVNELPYRRIVADEVIEHIRACSAQIPAADSGKALADIRARCLQPVYTFGTMCSLAFVRFTLDTRDEYYTAEKEYYDQAMPRLDAALVRFKQAYLSSPFVADAEAYVSPLIAKQYAVQVKCAGDAAVPYQTEENKIVTEYTKLMAETLFPWEGKDVPLSSLRRYFSDPDRAVRKKAYDVLGNTLASIGDKLDDIYDRLVKVRTQTAKVLGYDNYVQLGDNRMGRIFYDRAMLHDFRKTVLRDVVPAVTRLKRKLAKKLGIDDFMLYDNDTYFTQGNPVPVLDAAAMFEAGKRMYDDMGADTGKFFREMTEADAFDVFPREGKWGGGYCDAFHDFRQPFILANFNGTSGDVDVLTHEAGHAFAAYVSFEKNHDPDLVLGMETAETHSMSMEFLCYKYMRDFFGDRAEDYKLAHTFDALSFLPYGTIVDYFQEEVYTHPDMTPAERNALWNSLEAQFRPWLKTEGIPYLEKGTRWQYQMHIFESPMYYIDYCLAQSVALQFYHRSREDYPAAFAAYLDFVQKGATEEYPAPVTEAGLRSPFAADALKDVAEKTEALLFDKL